MQVEPQRGGYRKDVDTTPSRPAGKYPMRPPYPDRGQARPSTPIVHTGELEPAMQFDHRECSGQPIHYRRESPQPSLMDRAAPSNYHQDTCLGRKDITEVPKPAEEFPSREVR